MLKGTITLNDQEREGTYDFTKATLYMTRGFKHKFGDEAEELISSLHYYRKNIKEKMLCQYM